MVDGVSGAFAEAFEAVAAEFEDAVVAYGFDFVGEAWGRGVVKKWRDFSIFQIYVYYTDSKFIK